VLFEAGGKSEIFSGHATLMLLPGLELALDDVFAVLDDDY